MREQLGCAKKTLPLVVSLEGPARNVLIPLSINTLITDFSFGSSGPIRGQKSFQLKLFSFSILQTTERTIHL